MEWISSIAEKEKSQNSELPQGNAEKKPAWNINIPSNGDSGIRSVMGASSWPALSDSTKSSSNLSSSDSLKSLGEGSETSFLSLSEQNVSAASLNSKRSNKPTRASVSTNGQCSYASPGGQSTPMQTRASVSTNGQCSYACPGGQSTTPMQTRASVSTSGQCSYSSYSSPGGQSTPMQTRASVSTNGQCSYSCPGGQSAPMQTHPFVKFIYPHHLPGGQNPRTEIASSQYHGSTQNQYKNSYNNQSVNHHPHQEHRNQNWNLHGNFNGRGGFPQPPRGSLGYPRPPPPPPLPLLPPAPAAPPSLLAMQAQCIQIYQPPVNPFGNPIVFPVFAPPVMHPCLPVETPPPVSNPVNEDSLEDKIRRQVHYYFSKENLPTDLYMRKRMNDEGFVHIQFIAGFNMLKALTTDIELILKALQGSDVVEVKGYEVRSRHMWKAFLMPLHMRIPFTPSPNYEIQNLSIEQSAGEIGTSSSSNQQTDSNIN